jgi:hypothetical protein
MNYRQIFATRIAAVYKNLCHKMDLRHRAELVPGTDGTPTRMQWFTCPARL